MTRCYLGAVAESLIRRGLIYSATVNECRLANGRWLRVIERHTSDGGIVGVRVDMTEGRQREAVEREPIA
jgi:hypothetical protein